MTDVFGKAIENAIMLAILIYVFTNFSAPFKQMIDSNLDKFIIVGGILCCIGAIIDALMTEEKRRCS